MNDRRDPAPKDRVFFRATSWPSGGDANGENPDPVKDARSLINRSVSHEPNPKNSKGSWKSIISVLNTKRRKKSSDPSRNEGNYIEFESTFESSPEASAITSRTAASSNSEAAPQSCETVSAVPEAQRPSFLDTGLSPRESIASPISPEYESGFMSMQGNVQFIFSICSFGFRRDLMLMISMMNSQFRRGKRISFLRSVEYFASSVIFQE